jgi:hypothetical protein
MAYQCDVNDSCPRIPFYSANGYFFNGLPMGTPTENNARLIRERAASVAAWNSAPSVPLVQPAPVRPPVRRSVPRAAPVRAPMTPVAPPRPMPPDQRPMSRPTPPPVEPPQQAIVPAPTVRLTCGSSSNLNNACPGQNVMKAVVAKSSTTTRCTEYCIAEAYVTFWQRLGRTCGPCT